MSLFQQLKISIQPHLTYIITLLGIWILSIFLINPVGEFPLNDDWAYALSIKWFHETGQLTIANWGEMTLVGHLLWGGLFTYFTDFSHTTLRFSTIVLGFGSLATLYSIAIEVGFSRPTSFLMSLILLVNPVFMALSNTYMTDVPFTFFMALSLLFYLKAHKNQSYPYLTLAILMTLISLLYRQLAFVLPISWSLTQLALPTRSIKKWLWIVLPLVTILLTYLLYTFFMKEAGLLQPRFNDKLEVIQSVLFSFSAKRVINTIGYIIITLTYMGLFFSPYLVLQLKQSWTRFKWPLLAYTIVVSTILFLTGKLLPTLDNVWIDFGVGPTTLPDFYGNFNHTPPYNLHHVLQGILSVVAVFFGGVLGIQLIHVIRTRFRQFRMLFVVTATVIYLAPFMLVGIYDRYLLLLFLFGVILLFPAEDQPNSNNSILFSALGLTLFFLFSVCATHDYLSWNRVRWQALHEFELAHEKGQITGGVEYDAWHYYSYNDSTWWEHVPSDYAIVFSANESDTVIKTYQYDRWLPGANNMYIIKQSK